MNACAHLHMHIYVSSNGVFLYAIQLHMHAAWHTGMPTICHMPYINACGRHDIALHMLMMCGLMCCMARLVQDKAKNTKIEYLTQTSKDSTRFKLWGRVVARGGH